MVWVLVKIVYVVKYTVASASETHQTLIKNLKEHMLIGAYNIYIPTIIPYEELFLKSRHLLSANIAV